MKTRARWMPLALVFAFAVAPGAVDAQRRRDDVPDRAQIEQRIRAQMGRMMQDRLGLDEDEAARLSEIVQTFDGRRRELARREVETRRAVDELLRGGDQDAARALLQTQADLRLEEAQLFVAEQEALLDVLTPAQVLQLQDLRQDIGRRIRALRGGGRGPDADNGARGPGPRADGPWGGRSAPGARQPL